MNTQHGLNLCCTSNNRFEQFNRVISLCYLVDDSSKLVLTSSVCLTPQTLLQTYIRSGQGSGQFLMELCPEYLIYYYLLTDI